MHPKPSCAVGPPGGSNPVSAELFVYYVTRDSAGIAIDITESQDAVPDPAPAIQLEDTDDWYWPVSLGEGATFSEGGTEKIVLGRTPGPPASRPLVQENKDKIIDSIPKRRTPEPPAARAQTPTLPGGMKVLKSGDPAPSRSDPANLPETYRPELLGD